MTAAERPITVLIGAMGGEGGGVLMDWIVNAAETCGLPVQATSVPGVAQRTGATTYYIEIFPVPLAELAGREPVLSLYPGIGDVDLVVASELIEVGRALERGFVSPERTTLVGSTHRVYSLAERSAGTDGRYDGRRVTEAARKMAKRAVLFDVERAAAESQSVLNAVLLGAIAATGVLPIPPETFEEGIRVAAKAIESNLAGFRKGLGSGATEVASEVPAVAEAGSAPDDRPEVHGRELLARARGDYSGAVRAIVVEGVRRLVDFQDVTCARLYLDRLDAIHAADGNGAAGSLAAEAARYLALWMSYEDVIRVAQLKIRGGRYQRIRSEVGATPGEVVRVTEYLKPSLEELCSVLPSFLARPILEWAERRGLTDRLQMGLHVKSTTVSGFLQLWMIAKLRPLRRIGHRYQEEQRMIEGWLDLVRRAAPRSSDLAREIVECAHLIRGYGDTRRRGVVHFRRIVAELVEPALTGAIPAGEASEAVARARDALLANPEAAVAIPPLRPE